MTGSSPPCRGSLTIRVTTTPRAILPHVVPSLSASLRANGTLHGLTISSRDQVWSPQGEVHQEKAGHIIYFAWGGGPHPWFPNPGTSNSTTMLLGLMGRETYP